MIMNHVSKVFVSLSVLCLLIAIGPNTEICAQTHTHWLDLYNGPGLGEDFAEAIAVDVEGNVYVTGWSDALMGPPVNEDYCTIKYDPDGNNLWTAFYDGPVSGVDAAHDIAVDVDGNVYVTGRSDSASMDYLTIKYDPMGMLIYIARWDGPGMAGDEAYAIAVDDLGNAYVTGRCWGAGTNWEDMATIKYDPWGVQLWCAMYNSPNSGSDKAYDIALDSDLKVYITGSADGDYCTIKYTTTGTQVWSPPATYNGPGNSGDEARAIALDADGNVYVTGYSFGGMTTYNDYATIMYNFAGVQQWATRYDGFNDNDNANDIVVGSFGNIYVTGWSVNGIEDYATIKYSPTGAQQWVAYYDGPGFGTDVAVAMDIDNCENVYVTGYSDNDPNPTWDNYDYATLKYSKEGNLRWEERYNGPDNSWDKAADIVIDEHKYTYVTGFVGSEQLSDYGTIKYRHDMELFLDYVSGSPVPASGGNLYFDVWAENESSTSLNFDIWTAYEYQGGAQVSLVMRTLTNYLSGWAINRPNMYFPVNGSYAAGDYLMFMRVGTLPTVVWNEDCFPWSKSSSADGSASIPFQADGIPNPFDIVDKGVTPEGKVSLTLEEYSLVSARPNPFNPTTAISYQLPADCHVNLAVYDVSGRLVADLVNGMRDAGVHEVTFDGSNLASGIYFYRIEAGDFTSVRKMVLMK